MIDFFLGVAVTVVALGALIVSRNRGLIDALAEENADPDVARERAARAGRYGVNRVGLLAAGLALIAYVLTVLTVFDKVTQTLNAVILSVLLFFPFAIAAAFVYGLYGLLVTLMKR